MSDAIKVNKGVIKLTRRELENIIIKEIGASRDAQIVFTVTTSGLLDDTIIISKTDQ